MQVPRPEISVEEFAKAAKAMRLAVLAGGASIGIRSLNSSRVQKLGLAVSGFTHRIHSGRIQIFGNSEDYYFRSLDASASIDAVSRLDPASISCVVVTAGNVPPQELLEFAQLNNIPLLTTHLPSSEAIQCIAETLNRCLAPTLTIHGVLMDIFGKGVLLRGESGIGKSECALDLIGRGHRLVADDAVLMRRIGDRVTGEAPESIKDHFEIRGLGIINARELFGVSALSEKARIDLCLDFVGESEAEDIDRLGMEDDFTILLGERVVRYRLPVRPGRNLATLTETAVRVFVSRTISRDPSARWKNDLLDTGQPVDIP